MATILCLETSTTNCSVALSENGSVIALREDNSPGYSHAERLHVFIEEVLEEAKLKKSQLDAIAVSKGPGSYTGLRIGVSAAKGLCFALDKPLISIATLHSLATKVSSNSPIDYIVPMLDARRMEAYTMVFDTNFNEVRSIKAEILDASSFDSLLRDGKVMFIGNAVEKFQKVCEHTQAVFRSHELPSAQQMGVIAEAKYKKSDFEDVAYFEPYYLKDFIVN